MECRCVAGSLGLAIPTHPQDPAHQAPRGLVDAEGLEAAVAERTTLLQAREELLRKAYDQLRDLTRQLEATKEALEQPKPLDIPGLLSNVEMLTQSSGEPLIRMQQNGNGTPAS